MSSSRQTTEAVLLANPESLIPTLVTPNSLHLFCCKFTFLKYLQTSI